jgi:hypothetical protein
VRPGWIVPDTVELMIHRDHIERIRVLKELKGDKDPKLEGSAAAADYGLNRLRTMRGGQRLPPVP